MKKMILFFLLTIIKTMTDIAAYFKEHSPSDYAYFYKPDALINMAKYQAFLSVKKKIVLYSYARDLPKALWPFFNIKSPDNIIFMNDENMLSLEPDSHMSKYTVNIFLGLGNSVASCIVCLDNISGTCIQCIHCTAVLCEECDNKISSGKCPQCRKMMHYE